VRVDDLENRLSARPRDRDLTAGRRRPHSTYADKAVGAMRAESLRAHRLEGGFLAWRARQIEKQLCAIERP